MHIGYHKLRKEEREKAKPRLLMNSAMSRARADATSCFSLSSTSDLLSCTGYTTDELADGLALLKQQPSMLLIFSYLVCLVR
jgi:hypothetical protein